MNTASDPKSNEWDVEEIVDQVWSSLDGRVPRSTVCTTVIQLLKRFDDSVIRLYVPLLVQREATKILRSVMGEEMETMR